MRPDYSVTQVSDTVPERKSRRAFVRFLGGGLVCWPLKGIAAQAKPLRISVAQYRAKGDGLVLDTMAIQQAIDAASGAGGGTVLIPPGKYLTGTILIKDGVTLELASGATLLGSVDPADYRLLEPFVDGVGTARGYALIGCVDAHKVSIRGSGTIDGRGAALQASGGKVPSAKPFLLLCLRSSELSVDGISLVNSSAWTMHISQCSDVAVTNVTIHSVGLPNNDGIDIDSSQQVHVEGCKIETGDDAICLKTTSTQPCKDITVKSCTLTTRCAAFKIGTESAGDFSAIRMSDCHVIQANLGAIKILSVDGAHISDLIVERIRVDNADTPIFLRLGARGRTFRAGAIPRPVGTLSGIVIRDVEVKQARRVGILLAGIPGHPIEDISLQQIAIVMAVEAVSQIPSEPGEAISSYPEVRMFGGSLPAYGIFGRHLRGLRMMQVSIQGIPGDVRPEEVFSDRS